MKKFNFLFFILTLLMSSYAYCICPFYDTFNIRTSWGNGEIKVLEVTPKNGDERITANQLYNPSYIGSYFYYTTFTVAGSQCGNDKYADFSRNIEAKVGYDNDNYCIINVNDGTMTYASVISKGCVGKIEFDSFNADSATSIFNVGVLQHDYYIYFDAR